MDLHQFKLFQTAARLEHFTKAAKVLHIAQPALSKTIHQLEEDLGVPLFDRVGKNVVLNQNGEIVLRYIGQIFDSLEEMQNELRYGVQDDKGEVVLSMPSASSFLPALVGQFQKLYPDIKIQIVQYSVAQEHISWDICILASRLRLDQPNYAVLLQERLVLALPKEHPLAGRDSVELIEVAQEPFVGMHRGNALGDIVAFYSEMAGFTPNVVLESDNPATVRELLKLGIGISLIPEITWKDVESDRIRLVPVAKPECTRYLGILWKHQKHIPRSVQLFRDWATDFFQTLANNAQ